MELIESIIKSSEKVHFTYDENEVNNLSEIHSDHKKYLNDCWSKILSVDMDIYKDLYSKTPDKKHLDSIYKLMFYCNDCLLRFKELHNRINCLSVKSDILDITLTKSMLTLTR